MQEEHMKKENNSPWSSLLRNLAKSFESAAFKGWGRPSDFPLIGRSGPIKSVMISQAVKGRVATSSQTRGLDSMISHKHLEAHQRTSEPDERLTSHTFQAEEGKVFAAQSQVAWTGQRHVTEPQRGGVSNQYHVGKHITQHTL